jgi:hypothetical protein
MPANQPSALRRLRAGRRAEPPPFGPVAEPGEGGLEAVQSSVICVACTRPGRLTRPRSGARRQYRAFGPLVGCEVGLSSTRIVNGWHEWFRSGHAASVSALPAHPRIGQLVLP